MKSKKNIPFFDTSPQKTKLLPYFTDDACFLLLGQFDFDVACAGTYDKAHELYESIHLWFKTNFHYFFS